MSKRLLSAAVLSMFFAGCAAQRSADTSEPVAAVESANVDDDTLICEEGARTGSNLRRRSCKTVAQLRKEREAAQRDVQLVPRANPELN